MPGGGNVGLFGGVGALGVGNLRCGRVKVLCGVYAWWSSEQMDCVVERERDVMVVRGWKTWIVWWWNE